jgi:hypothetical protein
MSLPVRVIKQLPEWCFKFDLINMHDLRHYAMKLRFSWEYGGRHNMTEFSFARYINGFHLLDMETFIFNKHF